MEGTRHTLEQAQDLLLSRASLSPWLGPSHTAVSTSNWFVSGPAPGELGWEFLAQQAHQGKHAVSQNWGLARGEDTAQSLACHSRRIGTQDALKKESRGLSQVAAGNPGYV